MIWFSQFIKAIVVDFVDPTKKVNYGNGFWGLLYAYLSQCVQFFAFFSVSKMSSIENATRLKQDTVSCFFQRENVARFGFHHNKMVLCRFFSEFEFMHIRSIEKAFASVILDFSGENSCME